LVIALFNTVVLGMVFGSVTVMVAGWTERNQYGLLNALGLAGPVRFALALVLLDGWMYAWHRANHTIPFLWRFHRMHHSDRHMVHHSDRWPETDSNYSTVLSLWDRLAGSFRMRSDPKALVFGLEEFRDGSWQTCWSMFKTPFVNPTPSPAQPPAEEPGPSREH